MDLNYDNDWYRYFGDSTIHTVGRHGYAVGEDGSEREDSGRLGQNHGRDSD